VPTKRLHILANSRKKSQHCIAGREVLSDARGRITFGDWIRPVSRHGEGELSWDDCRFPSGGTPGIFDVVEIALEEREGSASQPENWFINPKVRWKKVDIDDAALPTLVFDCPRKLWMAPGERPDRISPDALNQLDCGASLYLIEASGFRIEMSWRSWEGNQRQRYRATFRYGGMSYDFSLTDPVALRKYCSPFPKPEEGPRTVRLQGGDDCTLCVSLAPPFNGHHYKIAATVIEQ
jgi:hypothetical protein